jgi:cysteine desulfurase
MRNAALTDLSNIQPRSVMKRASTAPLLGTRFPARASRGTVVYRMRVAFSPSPATPHRSLLDAGGNARLCPDARIAFEQALDQGWADSRRLYSEGRAANALLGGARAAIAEVLGARPEEVHFAPSHVAALHAAVRGVARGRRRAGGSIVTSSVERAAVLNAASFAVARAPHSDHMESESPSSAESGARPQDRPNGRALGPAEHRLISVDSAGRVDLDGFTDAVHAAGISLAALQHSNGEVGTLQPIEAAYAAARSAGVPLLVDAGAAVGHVAVPSAWDVLAADSADWGGPVGVGILVVRGGVRWAADWPEDEDAWFPGGVSVPAAFAAAVALQSCMADQEVQAARRRELIDIVRARVPQLVPDVDVVGDPDARLPHVMTFSCLYVDGESLVTELDREGCAVGSGSACTSDSLEPSHVLAAMGALTHGNIRIALDRTTTREDIDHFLAVLPGAVSRVRALLGVESL